MRDTIDMAREAGAIHIHGKPKEFALVGNENIKAFETLVRADEREACAKKAETLGVHPALNVWSGGPEWYKHGKDIAAAIRARGETK